MNWEERMLSALQPIAGANLFRMAKCHCGKLAVSNPKELAFFESGNKSTDNCRTCGYHEEPHKNGKIKDHDFSSSKPMPVDRFYCGCDGWD
jgi:hypothetical protein